MERAMLNDKVSSNSSTPNSSTPEISPDVAALTTEVSELKNMMKTILIDKQKAQAPAPVKVIKQSCVTCGGAHSYRNYPATDGNAYRDNIQDYVSQAAAANFNQGNTNSRPPMVANQIRPPGSLPSNTVTNPKEDLKGITTRSGVVYQGPTIPTSSPKVVEHRTEVTDKYGYIKNHKKTIKNKQARTRESEEYKKKPKNQSRSQKSQASVKSSQNGQTLVNKSQPIKDKTQSVSL
ncbi:hypothetical protein Tco_1328989 [Tanacetum coccineum]